MTQEFLTVPELAALLRIKERKVYDLAASGSVPCTRATGKLLFPEGEIRAWIERNRSGERTQRRNVFLGSHDPLLEWTLRQSQCGLATFFDGSTDGLRRFDKAEGIATGLHIQNASDADWNTEAVVEAFRHQDVVLLAWASRRRGLVLRKELQQDITDVGCLANHRVATRQSASGTAVLFDRLMTEAGVQAFEAVGPFHSEQDAVLSVQEGSADVAFGLEVMASQFGLHFLPLVTEKFDLLVDRASYFDAPFQTFLSFCQSAEFRQRAETLTGYDVNALGKVVWNT